MKHRNLIGSFMIVALVLLVGGIGVARSAALVPNAPLPKPENISCQGAAADTVNVWWKDTATDEDEYRVERKIGSGGTWSEVATLPADSNLHQETGVDTSSPNRYYRVRSYRTSDTSYSPYSDVCNNRRISTTDNFRVFYGLRGTDECPQIDGRDVCLADDSSGGKNIYVDLQETALEGSLSAFTRLGFLNDASTPPSGLDKIPINVVWCDGGGCAGGGGLGLSPLLMETPFDTSTRVGDPIAWLVALHEAFHFQQYQYPGLSDPANTWVYEGQARSIQDKICIGATRATAECFDDIATGLYGYVPQVNSYLGDPNRPIIEASYSAALFWTYLTEKYGTSDSADQVEAGMDLIVEFWEQANANPGHDGIWVVDNALATLGHSETFRDVWKDFAVASYAKHLSGPGVPAKYQYADMAQTGGAYNEVGLSLDEDLSLGEQVIDTDETVVQWGARYYEVRPAADVPLIDIKFTQDSANMLYYTVLGIKGTNLTYEYNIESRHLDHTLINDGYDAVVVVVAGLEHLSNYRYSFNGTTPVLQILAPTISNRARVGDPLAPDKFLVQVEIIDGAGVPLAGVDINNFSFRIGTTDVPDGNILTSAVVQDKYWFVIRAVTQSSAGLYDLYAAYGSGAFNDTETNAVDYSPRDDADSVLVIDRSGSMSGDNKLTSAQEAGRLFVDSWRTGDMIGVVSFNAFPNLELGLTAWTDTPSGGSRQDAFDAINALTATGGTNIGDSLRMAWDELVDHGNASHDWALVLLSDGKEEASDPTETFDQMINALRDATGKVPVVHAVAIGTTADRLRMQRIANVTGGTYQFVSLPSPLVTTNNGIVAVDSLQLALDSRYRAAATEIIGQQQFFSHVGPTTTNFFENTSIVVEGSAAELVLSLSWDFTMGDVFLYDPNDQQVAPFHTDYVHHVVWRVSNPMAGTWRLFVQEFYIPGSESSSSPDRPSALPPYLVQASLVSDVTMQVYLTTPEEERVPGVPMGIAASLTDTGPVSGATVEAVVEQPNGTLHTVTLYDDGNHGDGEANDGIYANTYYQTGQHGSYNVTVTANGSSNLSGSFTRQALLSFHMDADADGDGVVDDTDGDGLPDVWEILFGTDPNVPDQNEDPDNDGCNNWCEWGRGTDPHDSDTDDGGESDGTDPNPLDPSDDDVESIWGVAYPGDAIVYVKYVEQPEWWFVAFYRSEGPDGPFTFLGIDLPATGVYSDTFVTNGTEYCYQLSGWDVSAHKTANSAPTCATPNADPLPPHGWIMINDGAPSTFSTDVDLTLWASDSVDPHNMDEDFLPPPDSATGVADMMVSNYADFHDAAWETYATSKDWVLGQNSGLATVYVKYRDGQGNESEVYAASIWVGSGPGLQSIFLPIVIR